MRFDNDGPLSLGIPKQLLLIDMPRVYVAFAFRQIWRRDTSAR